MQAMLQFEWRALRADRAAMTAAVLLGAVLGYGLWNGWAWMRFQQQTIEQIRQEERGRIRKLKQQVAMMEARGLHAPSHSDPRLPGVVGMNAGALHATLPPHPLGFLSVGQSDLYPYYYRVTTRGRSAMAGNDEIENPLHLLSGRFDGSFVVIYLLPLVVLALSYNLLSGERENGTLAMVSANPAPWWRIVAAKLAVRFGLVAAVTAGGGAVAALLGGRQALVWLAMWMGAVLVYTALWFGAAVVVNTRKSSSASNAVTLAALWLVFVLLVPMVSGLVAESVYPAPSRVEMIQAMRAATNEANRQGGRVLAKYFEEHPELLPASGQPDAGDFMARFLAVQHAVETKMRPVLDAYEEQLEKQQALAARFRFLSPASLMQETLNTISGTSPERFRHFRAQVEQYQARWSDYFTPKVFRQARMTPADFEQLPRFAYEEEAFGAVAWRALSGVVMTGLAGLALLGLGMARLKQVAVLGVLAMMLVAGEGAALGQNINGTVTGSVTDPDGSAVGKAVVELSLSDRSQTRTTVTNEAGQYRISGLTPGYWEMRVSAAGFALYRRERVEVQVGAPLQLDVRLAVATVNEAVTVTTEVDEFDRALGTGARGALIGRQLLENVPALAGRTSRNYSTFVFLLPGTVVSRTPHAPFSVNGSRGQGTTNVMVDGADFNNPNTGSLLGANFTEQPVSQEALQTVEVQTSTFKAEYGRAAGGTINLITPSGTNDFHGRFYEFLRNDALDARNPMNSERPKLGQNQFGGLLTGRIVKDKLFFAVNGEWNLQRAANSAVPQPTFSAAERERAVPEVRALLELFPLPNTASGTTPLFDPGRVAEVLTGRTWFGKLDYVVSEKHQFGYRYTHVESLRRAANLFATGSAGWNEVYSHTFNLTSTLTPSVVNEARAYYTTYNIPLWPLTRFLGNPAVNGEVGLMSITGAANTGTIFRDDSRTHNYQVQNDVSINRGRHGVKLGVIGRRVFVNTTSRSLGDGQLVFDSRELFLQGRPRTYTRVLGDTRLDQVINEWGFYGQTDWRVRANLTLNLGVRYEFYTPPADKNRLRPNYETDWTNVAPRFGFAWSPGRQTALVVRGGYGLFYAPLAARYVGLTRLTPPRVRTVIALNPVLGNLLGGPLVESNNLTITDPNLRQPYMQQWNLTTELRVPGTQLVASVGYVGTRGTALPMTRLPNGGDRLAQNLRPDQTRGVVTLLETAANSNYHALQSQLTGNLTRALTVRAAYTWSKSIDEVSRDTVNILAQNNRRLDRGVSEFDVPHNFTAALVYRLPGSRVWKTALSGWQVSPVMQVRAGYPFSLLSGGDTPEGVRINRINPVAGMMTMPLAELRARATPAAGQYGMLGRNTFRAERFMDVSVGVQKEFVMSERWRLQLRGEAFNVLNMTNFDTYATNLLDPRFLQPITAYPARAMQLSVRLGF